MTNKTIDKRRITTSLGIFALATILLTGFSLPSDSFAAISSVANNMVVYDPAPASVIKNTLLNENDDNVWVFQEKENHELAGILHVDITNDGTHTKPLTVVEGPADIPAGTIVNSYFIFADRIGGGCCLDYMDQTVTFDNDIIGVIILQGSLNDSDAELALAGTTYPVSAADRLNRGLDYHLIDDDSITVSGSTLTVELFQVGSQVDSLRVITEGDVIIDLGEECNDDTTREICKSAIAIDENDTGYIEVGELIVFQQEIKVTNPSDGIDWQNTVITDNFGAEIQNISCDLGAIGDKKGKSVKHFLTWEIGFLPDNNMQSNSCTSETGVNPDGSQLYTECGIHEYNSGAVVKAEIEKDNAKKLQQISFSTDSILVEVFTVGKVGDCDFDDVIDSADLCPFEGLEVTGFVDADGCPFVPA